MNRYKAITEETREKVFEAFKSGKPMWVISDMFNLSIDTVFRILKSMKNERKEG